MKSTKPSSSSVVSDRLIDRIDQMLGRPTPIRGDPIRAGRRDHGAAERHTAHVSTGTVLKVTRITDQDPAFLRFGNGNLKPGQRGGRGPGAAPPGGCAGRIVSR
jgi:hypothetical protein